MNEIRPQHGPQERFLASSADIAIYGGSAGGGKSFALLLEAARHMDNAEFGGVIFRRTSPQLTGAGSLWEEAQALFQPVGARFRQSPSLEVQFQSGAMLQMLHLQHMADVYEHQGKQYAFIGFDELTHFLEAQFWYLVSRLRSTCGVRPYMRCTTNPDPDSFVRGLIGWWIGDDGQPIRERSGVLRYFVRVGSTIVLGDSAAELSQHCSDGDVPMSLTFIAARLEDNPALLAKDPQYRARLKSLPEVERQRLLDGNWDIRPEGGKYILREYLSRRWSEPSPPLSVYIASDYAVSEPRPGEDPDYTEHGVFGISPDDDLFVLDWWSGQTKADVWVEVLLDKVARWKPLCVFGEAGVIKSAVEPFLVKRMRERRIYARIEWLSTTTGAHSQGKQGFDDPSKRAKAIRGRAFQARAALGKILFPGSAAWADRVVDQCVGFPNGHDDAFDVLGHMCRAIDQAHPAIVQSKPTRQRDAWDDDNQKAAVRQWRVV